MIELCGGVIQNVPFFHAEGIDDEMDTDDGRDDTSVDTDDNRRRVRK